MSSTNIMSIVILENGALKPSFSDVDKIAPDAKAERKVLARLDLPILSSFEGDIIVDVLDCSVCT